MKQFLLNLQFIFKPWYWFMNEPYSKDMDDIINHLLDYHEFENVTEHTALLGGKKIWISNRPYSCMMLDEHKWNCRPSRLTIKRGLDRLDSRLNNDYEQQLIELKQQILNTSTINTGP